MDEIHRDELPPGFGLVLDPATRRLDGGRVLVGGAPLRLLRLTPAGARVVDELAAGGRPVRASAGVDAAWPGACSTPAWPSPARPRRPGRRPTSPSSCPPAPAPAKWPRPRRPSVRSARSSWSTTALFPRSPPRAGRSPPGGAVLVRHDRPRGPAAARNAGWRRASTALIAFVDADCEPPPGWLEALLPHFADPTVAGVAPRVISASRAGLPRLAGGLRRGALAARPRRSPSPGGAGRPGAVCALGHPRGAGRHPRRRGRVRRAAALRRGRRPGLAPCRSRLDGALRAGRGRDPPHPGDPAGVAPAALPVRHVRRPAGRPARRRRDPAAGVGVERAGVGPGGTRTPRLGVGGRGRDDRPAGAPPRRP